MQNNIQNILMFLLTFIAANQAVAQVTMASATNPSTPQYIHERVVYEYGFVDEQPQFHGGERALINYINRTREYPYSAYSRGVEGRVVCSFIINPDGSVSHIKILKGAETTLNKEAIRILSLMPRWKAGKIDKEAVPVRCILPIAFRL